MISPSVVPLLGFLFFLPGFLPVINCQSPINTTIATIPQPVIPSGQYVTPQSTDSVLQKICLNVDEYRSMFTSILGDNSVFSRDTIARMMTWVDWFYNAYNRYRWMIDFAIGALMTMSVFLPGGPLVPIAIKVGTTIAMDPNMRRLIKEIMYEVWTMIAPTGSEQYNVAMENTMVVVRQMTNSSTGKLFKRAVVDSMDTVDWRAILASLTQQLADLQRKVYNQDLF